MLFGSISTTTSEFVGARLQQAEAPIHQRIIDGREDARPCECRYRKKKADADDVPTERCRPTP